LFPVHDMRLVMTGAILTDPILDHMAPAAAQGTPVVAIDVVRGVSRLFARQGWTALVEVPLPNGRRADIVAIDAQGQMIIVEVKVARGDLVGDAKWPDYLEWCDRFYWALSVDLDPGSIPLGGPDCGGCGLIVADRYDAALVREAEPRPLAPARRRAQLLRIGRLAMRRMMMAQDPDIAAIGDAAY
jgi:hypothetical protein